MYKKVSSELNFVPREKEVLAFWKERQIFQKSVRLRKGAKPYTFFDGPPTANGKPHIGHVLTRSIKDIIPRYKTMKGFDVLRKAGYNLISDIKDVKAQALQQKMLEINKKYKLGYDKPELDTIQQWIDRA